MGTRLSHASVVYGRHVCLLAWATVSSEDAETMSEIDSGGIFVSYRRQDTRHVAGRLFDRLAERFGRSHVFMDVISIEPGLDFSEEIDDAVSACAVLLALIGQSWLDAVRARSTQARQPGRSGAAGGEGRP